MQDVPCQSHCFSTRLLHPARLSAEAANIQSQPRCIRRSSHMSCCALHHSRVSCAPPQLPGPSQSSKLPQFWCDTVFPQLCGCVSRCVLTCHVPGLTILPTTTEHQRTTSPLKDIRLLQGMAQVRQPGALPDTNLLGANSINACQPLPFQVLAQHHSSCIHSIRSPSCAIRSIIWLIQPQLYCKA